MTRRDDAIGRRLRGAAIVAAAVFLLLLGIVAAATAWGDELPDDPKLLKAMIGALRSSLARRNAEIAALGKRIEAQAAEIRRLRAAATTRPATTGPATQAASWSPDTGPAPFRRSARSGVMRAPLAIGSVGRLGYDGRIHVVQVIDERNMLAIVSVPQTRKYAGDPTERRYTVWIAGHLTRGLVDASGVELRGSFEITTTRRYPTAAGGTRTVFVAVPVGPKGTAAGAYDAACQLMTRILRSVRKPVYPPPAAKGVLIVPQPVAGKARWRCQAYVDCTDRFGTPMRATWACTVEHEGEGTYRLIGEPALLKRPATSPATRPAQVRSPSAS